MLFLNGDLAEEVFMVQPKGFTSSDASQVCKLNKVLYGLKQAPRAWFTKLSHTLHQFGFSSAKSDVSLFTQFSPTSTVYILVYIDDILITGNDPVEIYSLIQQLNTIFSLKDLSEMSYFLGVEVNPSPTGGLHLSQKKYISDLLHRVGMRSAKPVPTPMISNLKLSAHGSTVFSDLALYRSVVGGLQYATITGPDISFAVNKVSQFMHSTLEDHWTAVKRILRYLAGTLDQGL